MSSIGDINTNELLNLDLVDLESCFDPLFYPSEDFRIHRITSGKKTLPSPAWENTKLETLFIL